MYYFTNLHLAILAVDLLVHWGWDYCRIVFNSHDECCFANSIKKSCFYKISLKVDYHTDECPCLAAIPDARRIGYQCVFETQNLVIVS